MKKLKGGIETIITIIIVVGLVLLAIILAVLPLIEETQHFSDTGVKGISSIGSAMGFDRDEG